MEEEREKGERVLADERFPFKKGKKWDRGKNQPNDPSQSKYTTQGHRGV